MPVIDQSAWLALCCHGLGVVQPIDQLAAVLNAKTPLRFEIVGAADPMLEHGAIASRVTGAIKEGKRVIFIGHSKGAMLAYYLSVYSPTLTIAIDPTCWGSNINTAAWAFAAPGFAGTWRAAGHGRFINFHQSGYPGGGKLENPSEPTREDYFFPQCDHMSIVNDPRTVEIVRMAVMKAVA